MMPYCTPGDRGNECRLGSWWYPLASWVPRSKMAEELERYCHEPFLAHHPPRYSLQRSTLNIADNSSKITEELHHALDHSRLCCLPSGVAAPGQRGREATPQAGRGADLRGRPGQTPAAARRSPTGRRARQGGASARSAVGGGDGGGGGHPQKGEEARSQLPFRVVYSGGTGQVRGVSSSTRQG